MMKKKIDVTRLQNNNSLLTTTPTNTSRNIYISCIQKREFRCVAVVVVAGLPFFLFCLFALYLFQRCCDRFSRSSRIAAAVRVHTCPESIFISAICFCFVVPFYCILFPRFSCSRRVLFFSRSFQQLTRTRTQAHQFHRSLNRFLMVSISFGNVHTRSAMTIPNSRKPHESIRRRVCV